MYAGLDYRIHFEAIRSDAVCISAYYKSSFVYVIHSGMEWIFLCDKTVKQTAVLARRPLAYSNSVAAMLAWTDTRIAICQMSAVVTRPDI